MISAPPISAPDLQPDDGDYRDEPVLEDVPHDDRPLAQPLRPGRAHVVLTQHLQHGRARQAHDTRCARYAHRQRGQRELLQVA